MCCLGKCTFLSTTISFYISILRNKRKKIGSQQKRRQREDLPGMLCMVIARINNTIRLQLLADVQITSCGLAPISFSSATWPEWVAFLLWWTSPFSILSKRGTSNLHQCGSGEIRTVWILNWITISLGVKQKQKVTEIHSLI